MIGTLVVTKLSMLGNPAGSVGICYDTYNLGTKSDGNCFIFENGNYDGFSNEEKEVMLTKVGQAPDFSYTFEHVMTLSRDFDNDKFKAAFAVARTKAKHLKYLKSEAGASNNDGYVQQGCKEKIKEITTW
jgi:hypothetical protein